MTFNKRTKTKRIIALFMSVLMCFSIFASLPITAWASSTQPWTYWESDGYAYKGLWVNAKDAFCIDFGNAVSDIFRQTDEAKEFYNNLSHFQKKAINKIIIYSNSKGYINSNTNQLDNKGCVYYAAVQRAIWSITDPRASEASLSDYFKAQTQSLYDEIMSNYEDAVSADELPSVDDISLTADNNYSQTLTLDNLDKVKISKNAGLNVSIDGNELTISADNTFTGTKKILLTSKDRIYNLDERHAGISGEQHVIATLNPDYIPIYINVTSEKAVVNSNTGSITATVNDIDTNSAVNGATIQVSYVDNNGDTQKQTKTINNNGKITFNNLPVYLNGSNGEKIKYLVTKTSDATDYLNAGQKTVSDIELSTGKTETVSFETMKKLGDIKVIESVESLSGTKKGQNVNLVLTSKDGKRYEAKSNSNGETYFCNVPVGAYTLTTNDNKYFSRSDKIVVVDWDKNSSVNNRTYSNDASQFSECVTQYYGSNKDAELYENPALGECPDPGWSTTYDSSKLCTLEIYAQDASHRLAPLSDVEILVYNVDQSYYETFKTNEDGYVTIDNLPMGTYYFRLAAPYKNYNYSDLITLHDFSYEGETYWDDYLNLTIGDSRSSSAGDSDFEVSSGTITTNIVTNTDAVKRGDLKISKNYEILGTNPLGPDAGRNPGEGFKFEVSSTADDNALGTDLKWTVTTGSDGTVNLADIPVGEYTVSEVDVPNMYKTPDSKTVTVTWDNEKSYNNEGTTSFSSDSADMNTDTTVVADFENLLNRSKINGVNKDENGKALEGAVFGIFGAAETEFTADKAYATSTSDKDGNFAFLNVPYGEYIVAQIQAPNGYIVKADPKPFDIDSTQKNYSVEFTNAPVKGRISIVSTGEGLVSAKLADDNTTIIPVYGPTALKGIEFGVYAKENVYENGVLIYNAGDLIETVKTDENGVATSSDLPLGKYFVSEVNTINGYTINRTIFDVELKFVNDTTTVVTENVSVENKRQTLSISFKNSMETDDKYNIGKNDEYKDIRFTLTTAEDIKALDGTVIPKGSTFDVATPDENGMVAFTADLPYGYKYSINETSTNKKYALNDTVQKINYNFVDSEAETFEYYADGEEVTINNKIIRGTITITKTDKNGKALAGVKIEVLDENGNVVEQGTTDKNGKVSFTLPYGKYSYRDTEVPDGYILDKTAHEFTIDTNEQNIEETGEVEAVVEPEKVNTGYEIAGFTALGLVLIAAGVVIAKSRKRKAIK